jgi:hypothetical protein
MIPYGGARACLRPMRLVWRVWKCQGIIPERLNAPEHRCHDSTPEVPQRQQRGYGWPTRHGRGLDVGVFYELLAAFSPAGVWAKQSGMENAWWFMVVFML